jgi:hypothetical protein
LHLLVKDKTGADQAAEAEHKREQPNDAGDRWSSAIIIIRA